MLLWAALHRMGDQHTLLLSIGVTQGKYVSCIPYMYCHFLIINCPAPQSPSTIVYHTPRPRKNQQRLTSYTFTFLTSCTIIQRSVLTSEWAATNRLTGSAAAFCPSVSSTAGGLFNPNFSARFLFFSSSAASLAANSLGNLSALTAVQSFRKSRTGQPLPLFSPV